MSFKNNKLHFYIGSYTEMLAEDFGGSGKGIYVLELNLDTGEIKLLSTYKLTNPAYLTVNASHVYAISEVEEYKHPKVSAFKIKDHGVLEFVNEQHVEGSLPCHINIQHKTLLVACYGSGNVLSFPVDNEGKILKHNYNFKHTGKSINMERQEAPHAHQVVIHPEREEVFVPDLGIDKIKVYQFNNQVLTPMPRLDIDIPKGNGPRHMVFHRNGNLAYVMNELTGNVTVLKLEGDKFQYKDSYKSLPQTFTETPSGAAIRIHPNGKYLYVANRTIDSITIFKIQGESLELLDYQYTNGTTIREFNITPDGNWLIACLQDSNEVISYSILSSGLLQEKQRNTTIISPVCVCF